MQTDVCIVDRDQNDILLLVQEDKHFEEGDPEAQLIAETIAAFEQRAKADVDPLEEKVCCRIVFPVVLHR